MWVGLQNILSAGTRLDLFAQIYKDSTVISSGHLNSFFPGLGIGGVFGAAITTIPMSNFSPGDFPDGTNLSLKLSVRNACFGSLRNQGIARLWYNDSAANSRFGATLGGVESNYYLVNNFLLNAAAGSGPRKFVDVEVGKRCGDFKTFGTWTITP